MEDGDDESHCIPSTSSELDQRFETEGTETRDGIEESSHVTSTPSHVEPIETEVNLESGHGKVIVSSGEQTDGTMSQQVDSNNGLTCIIHIGDGNQFGEIKPFHQNFEQWEKVQDCAAKRKQSFSKSKYDNVLIQLPSVFQCHHGYHKQCYKNFTAVPKCPADSTPSRATRPSRSTGASPVLKPVCIFCNQVRKKNKGSWETLSSCEKEEAEINIRKAAADLEDDTLLDKIGRYDFKDGPDFFAMEVKYHIKSCKVKYMNEWRTVQRNKIQKGDADRSAKANALEVTRQYVQKEVVENKNPVFVTDILDMYRRCFVSAGGNRDNIPLSSVQVMAAKLKKMFDSNTISIESESTKRAIVFSPEMTIADARTKVSAGNENTDRLTWDCAMKLREEILQLENKPLEEPLTVETIMKGEVDIPNSLTNFLRTLYTGSTHNLSTRKMRLVDSTAADMVYSCSGGKLLPGKHLALAIGLKSMTGSKKITSLINRFGHCASNEKVRRVDIGLESTITQSTGILPEGIEIVRDKPLGTGIAWDNFDINLETLSGADSIHHTFGICFQNEQTNQSGHPQDQNMNPERPVARKRKIKDIFLVNECQSQDELPPYIKKPKMRQFSFANTNIFPPDTLPNATDLDNIWEVLVNFFDGTPFWTGWNAKRLGPAQTIQHQKVRYMRPIPLPPTRVDVVKEVLTKSNEVRLASGEDVLPVAFDLAIAKIALQIQCEESPEFADLFIIFGQFHTEMNVFSSLGTLIEGSGGPYLLSEAGIVAAGSLNRFLKGKMYNRCRRSHILLCTAMRGLHFSQFVKDSNVSSVRLHELFEWSKRENVLLPPELSTLLIKYQFYTEETLTGAHGKTAQFWMKYVRLVEMYLLLHRGMKENDIDLYAFSLFQLTPLFFVTNHHNYSRWMSLFSLQLANLKEDNPKAYTVLKNGAFSVNRTKKPFAAVGIDMALEQTINADAKSRLKGMLPFADIASAVNRWVVTNATRSEIANQLLEIAELKDYHADSKDLTETRVGRDRKDLEKLKETIAESVNPFSRETDREGLFNLKTGKQCSAETEKYLLHENGIRERDNFISECNERPERFEEPIKKMKITNFALSNFKTKNKSSKADEIATLKGTRDMYGRLLFLAAQNQLDLALVFSYPLLPEPPCFTHPDGSLRTSPKSKVFHHLKKDVASGTPESVRVFIADGMFLVHTFIQRCTTYGALARKIMSTVVNSTTERADICFDVFHSPSIKDVERTKRGNDDSVRLFSIGPQTIIEKDVVQLLQLSSFKKELLRFLDVEFSNDKYAAILGEKMLYCAIDNECKKYSRTEGHTITVDLIPELFGYHEEADTRVAFHAKHADVTHPGNIVVRANDADIAVILITNAHLILHSNLWYDAGLDYNNTREYVDIIAISKHMKNPRWLAGSYAFLGLDYSPSFFGKGKVRPMELIQRTEEFKKCFETFGEEELTWKEMGTVEKLVCDMYGYRAQHCVNDVRFQMFVDHAQPKAKKGRLDSIKAVDPLRFPPCLKELEEQAKRAWFVASLYKTATDAYPCSEHTPIDFGSSLSGCKDFLEVKWFDGEQVPVEIENIIGDLDDESDFAESDSESDSDSDD